MATPIYRQKPIPPAIMEAIDELVKGVAEKAFRGQPGYLKGSFVSTMKARLAAGIRRDGGDDLDVAFRSQ